MDLKQKCEEVMKSKEWTNEDLATYLGVSPSNLSSAKAGRRALPYQAIIKLEQLRGTKAEKIIDELLRIAACVALAVVVIFSTVGTNPAYASMTYEVGNAGNTNYRGFISRRFRMLFAFLRHHLLPSPNGRLALGIA